MTPRIVAVVLVLAAALGAGGTLGVQALLGGGEPSTTVTHFAPHFPSRDISFDYPASWQRQTYQKESSFSSAIVFLSTDPMNDPCVTIRTEDRTTITCGWPVDRLDGNGVLIEWSANGFPGWTLSSQAGSETTIAGLPAKILRETPGDCKAVDGDMTITAFIGRDVAGNWYQMRACLRGPNLDEIERQISLILATAEIR